MLLQVVTPRVIVIPSACPFALAGAFGSVGLESLLALLLETVRMKMLSLPAALHLVTSSPAQILGLQRGRLAVGMPADLVQFDRKHVGHSIARPCNQNPRTQL